MNGNGYNRMESKFIFRHHNYETRENQCSSALAEHIKTQVHLNYSSIISLHPEVIDGRPGTLVIESFVVDGTAVVVVHWNLDL
ncbi:hypothetical protein GIB67_025377 [Kingdonia uniflora]|uniref:Uncharacterized protein n=1 Tax=Kingdonia uniflora TaxID=39325 RepID=A0A7J7NBC7_9MAGN|nr:hypothetical protein GIB67_025377 [Kingdonia uniflora]